MAYDQQLAQRVKDLIQGKKDIREKRMFSGLAFIKHDRMAVGVSKDMLIIKTPKDDYAKFLKKPGAEPMNFTKRTMKGFVVIREKNLKSSTTLKKWVSLGFATADKMGPKTQEEKDKARRQKQIMSRYDELDKIINQFPKSIQDITQKLRETIQNEGFMFVQKAYPGWKAIGYRHQKAGYVCGVFPGKEKVKLVFEHGAKIKDPHRLLKGSDLKQIRYLEFTTPESVEKMADHIGDFLRSAISYKYGR